MKKLYYSISEISSLIDEEQHILRYWEKEFDSLKPRKNRAGNRVYSEKDYQTVKLIKKILREDKLSLKGAKEKLSLLLTNAGYLENDFKSNETVIDNKDGKTFNNSIVNTDGNATNKSEIVTLLKQILVEIENF